MTRIVLATLNARYSHASFGLRYLLANLESYRSLATLCEFTIVESPVWIVEQLLAENPTIIGFGVYIWNVTEITAVIRLLKTLRPDIRIVIGGPEVTYEYEGTEIFQLCDHLIAGEGDIAFRELIAALLSENVPPKVIQAAPPDIASLQLPYDEYTDKDLRERLIYVEASRGCPFQCEFCLSSLDERVRAVPLQKFLAALAQLVNRGARSFKFVDRTFNLNLRTSMAIVEFCWQHYSPGFELHFEMIPDRLPEELRALLAKFPVGAVQLELGIQSFTPIVLKNISRPQNIERIGRNLQFLREETGVHVHADLLCGLPGESVETFAAGFDRLLAMGPEEIQIGFLKRLRGTPIIRHTESSDLRYSPQPPYEILQTGSIPFDVMQRLKRFARYFDLFYNSGSFRLGMEMLFSTRATPFAAFSAFSAWLYETTRQTHELALTRRYQLLFSYLTTICGSAPRPLAEALIRDYDRHKIRRERLEFLRPYVNSVAPSLDASTSENGRSIKRRGQTPIISPPVVTSPVDVAQPRRLPVLP